MNYLNANSMMAHGRTVYGGTRPAPPGYASTEVYRHANLAALAQPNTAMHLVHQHSLSEAVWRHHNTQGPPRVYMAGRWW